MRIIKGAQIFAHFNDEFVKQNREEKKVQTFSFADEYNNSNCYLFLFFSRICTSHFSHERIIFFN